MAPQKIEVSRETKLDPHVEFTAWNELANAIVVRAAEDYRSAIRRLFKALAVINDPDISEKSTIKKAYKNRAVALKQIREIEKFFHSNWFFVCTKVDPDWLMEQLKKDIQNPKKKFPSWRWGSHTVEV